MSSYLQPKSPLTVKLMIVPDGGETADDISHWDRPLP